VTTGDVLGLRALNRALLDRQMLLRRHQIDVLAAVEHLVGLQAQVPKDPYTGLWARIEGFGPEALSRLLVDRRVVRMSMMRSTIHLVSALDARRLRPLLEPVVIRINRDSVFGRPLAGLDLDEVAEAGRRLVDERPRTARELGALLGERWPDRDPAALAIAARSLVPMVQVTPRGTWGARHQATWAALETWLGDSVSPVDGTDLSPDGLVLRYLAAWGPASVKDAQAWCGLTRLGEVFERLRPGLRTFRTEGGGELFDLPGAPRPEPDTPAPARFLPEYDNLGLGLADRSRLVADDRRLPSMVGTGVGWGTVLVDGCFHGVWQITEQGGTAVLTVAPTARVARRDQDGLEEEGMRLLGLHAAGIGPDGHAVRFADVT
jgi:hypothetical protein